MKRGIKSGIRTGAILALVTILIFVLVPVAQPAETEDREVVSHAVIVGGNPFEEATADWSEMVERLDEAIRNGTGQNVNFSVGDTFEIPPDILQKLAGKNATLGLHTSNGITFSISGRDVGRTDEAVRAALTFEPVIPEEVKQKAAGPVAREFCMEEKEAFPCRVNVHLGLGEENAGRHAVLYSYDEARGTLVQEGIFQITAEGHAMFGLKRGDEYAVAVMGGHTVTEGETLSHIAVRNGVTLQALEAANPQIRDADRIRIGQPVNIPAAAVTTGY